MANEQNLQPPAANQPARQPLTQPDAPVPAQIPAASSSISFQKILMIGVPVFILQVVVIYFLMVKVIAKPSASSEPALSAGTEKAVAESAELNLFVVKDIIINPAGTNGGRFLLATIGVDVNSPEALQELNKKEVQVRDVLNTVLTEKTLPQLIDVTQRGQLRTEMGKKIGDILVSGKVKNIYFSKFIIQ
ncbi:MAG TPA: flagellar basal body-associated FliL family protein [Bacteroidota bacterium]|nr:flagellar basal body-associated FliL family protein [Bacteroidota bacterium]